ncbi:MAG: hypothetical protein M3326_07755, partial [Actinomycetota bacterium]|nr:hypothetical protein [Actinomycetota bacterium]
ALVYGATPVEGGGVALPRGLTIYAVVLHVVAFGLLWGSVLRGDGGYSRRGVAIVASLLLLATLLSTRSLVAALRCRGEGPVLRSAGMLHLVTLLAAPVVLLVPLLEPGMVVIVALLYLVPLVPHRGLPEMLRWIGDSWRTAAGRRGGAGAMPRAGGGR